MVMCVAKLTLFDYSTVFVFQFVVENPLASNGQSKLITAAAAATAEAMSTENVETKQMSTVPTTTTTTTSIAETTTNMTSTNEGSTTATTTTTTNDTEVTPNKLIKKSPSRSGSIGKKRKLQDDSKTQLIITIR
jgi:hypothetical protein